MLSIMWCASHVMNTSSPEDRQRETLSHERLSSNVASNIEDVLAATPHKAPTIRPPASHLENYSS